EKGHVERDRSQHAHVFSARTSRDMLVGRRLRAMAQELTGGMMAPLLAHLVRAEALTPAERRELRELIDNLEQKKPQASRRCRRGPAVRTLLEFGLANPLCAAALAVLALVVGRVCRRPALVHGLWLLVLVKLVTPPLLPLSFQVLPPDEEVAIA